MLWRIQVDWGKLDMLFFFCGSGYRLRARTATLMRSWLPCILLVASITGCFLVPTRSNTCAQDQDCADGLRCAQQDGICVPGLSLDGGDPTDGSGQGSDSSVAVPACTKHGDCPSLVCVREPTDIMANYCLPPSGVVYVDPPPASCTDTTGARDAAFCSLQTAIAKVGAGQVIRLLPAQSYGTTGITISTGRQLTIYGPAEPQLDPLSPALANTLSGDPAIRVSGANTKLILDGVVLSGPSGLVSTGTVECTDRAEVSLRRSIVRGSVGFGVYADRCVSVNLDRTQVVGNHGAIYLNAVDNYSVANTLIAANLARPTDDSAIRITASTGAFRFSTMVNNQARANIAGAFQREGTPILHVQSSIVTGNQLSSAKSQFFPLYGYDLLDVTVGADPQQVVPVAADRLHTVDPVFTSPSVFDFSLVDDSGTAGPNSQCCLQKVVKAVDIGVDLYGRARSAQTEPGAISR